MPGRQAPCLDQGWTLWLPGVHGELYSGGGPVRLPREGVVGETKKRQRSELEGALQLPNELGLCVQRVARAGSFVYDYIRWRDVFPEKERSHRNYR